ncbi:RNI-like protein [Panus rudis PR-1116 ss-1]|nr:RNI-like protein [Panus rudis PR-1116 ss-1]
MLYRNQLPSDAARYTVEQLEFQPNIDHGITDDVLANILADCPNIQGASLSGIPDLTDRTVILLARSASSLREIDLSGCQQITNLSIFELASQATSLEVVKLNHVVTLTDPSISALALSLPHLITLELSHLPFITASSVRDIWTFARTLRKLKLARCPQITDKGFPSISTEPSADMHRFAGSWLDILPPLILPSHHILEDLRTLDLSFCYKLTDQAIAGIVRHAPKIQQLYLAGCVELTDNALRNVAQLGHFLEVLSVAHLEKITDRGVTLLVRDCPRLKSVDISYCLQLTDLAITELGSLPFLRRLSVISLHNLTDNAIFFLAEHAQNLARVHLSQCPQISLEAFQAMIKKLVKLEHVHACGIPSLKRVGIKRFSKVAPRGYDRRFQGPFRVFEGNAIDELRFFLDKEDRRRWECEKRNIIYEPRGDDSEDLY